MAVGSLPVSCAATTGQQLTYLTCPNRLRFYVITTQKRAERGSGCASAQNKALLCHSNCAC